jgi:hypothetical protein
MATRELAAAPLCCAIRTDAGLKLWVVTAAGSLAFGFAAALLMKSAAWDLRNYHYYNAYSLLSNRSAQDILVAQMQVYLNPLPEFPFFWLNALLPGRLVAFVLGAIHGLNFGLLYLIVRRVLPVSGLTALVIVSVGVTGAANLSEIGTTFYDYLSSLGVLGSLALMLDRRGTTIREINRRGLLWSLLTGLPLGLAIGAKLTTGLYAAPFLIAFFYLRGSGRVALGLSLACALGVALGVLLIGGYWMMHLWTTTGNPIFPFFNSFFSTSILSDLPSRDTKNMPQSFAQWLLFPVGMSLFPMSVAEVPWQDFRFLILALLAVLPVLKPFSRSRRSSADWDQCDLRTFNALSLFVALAYPVWLWLFATLRYALPSEMLAPLMIVLWIGVLPIAITLRQIIVVVIFGALLLSTKPMDWGRVAWGSWGEPFIETHVPPETVKGKTLVLMTGHQATAYVVPAFPPTARFIRISSDTFSSLFLPFFDADTRAALRQHWDNTQVLFTVEEAEDRSEQFRSVVAALRRFDLEAKLDECIPITTNLAVNGPPLLCPVRPLHPGPEQPGEAGVRQSSGARHG